MTQTYRASLLALLTGCYGCMAQYKPPTVEQPHAIVKFRRTYESTAGAKLNELIAVNGGWVARKETPTRDVGDAHIDAALIHPGDSLVKLEASFSHVEMQSHSQTYSCGNSTCSRTVRTAVTVVDGVCRKKLGVRLQAHEQYLVQLTYQDGRNCSASCVVQEKVSETSFNHRPCTRLPELED